MDFEVFRNWGWFWGDWGEGRFGEESGGRGGSWGKLGVNWGQVGEVCGGWIG